MQSEQKSSWQIFLEHLFFCAIAGGMIYLPMTLTPFQRHDDYLLASYNPVNDIRKYEGYTSMVGSGRFLLAEITHPLFYPVYAKYVYNSGFFIGLRLLNLIFLILAFSLFSLWMTKVLLMDKIISGLISILLLTLPGFQFLAAQAVAATNVWCIPLAMASVLILDDGRRLISFKVIFRQPARIAISLFLLLITLFTYQTYILVFLWPSLSLLIFAERSTWPWKDGSLSGT